MARLAKETEVSREQQTVILQQVQADLESQQQEEKEQWLVAEEKTRAEARRLETERMLREKQKEEQTKQLFYEIQRMEEQRILQTNKRSKSKKAGKKGVKTKKK
jgi:hypothetical protein